MDLIIKGRQNGKTAKLIKMSVETSYPIVTSNSSLVKQIKEYAEKIHYDIPEPVDIQHVINGGLRGKDGYENILIDEIGLANNLIDKALEHYLGCHVVACTASPVDTDINDKQSLVVHL